MSKNHDRFYERDLCVFRSKSKNLLKEHKENIHGSELKCRKCKETFMDNAVLKTNLENHEQISKKEEFNCETCDFQDTLIKALRKHLEISSGHKPSDKLYECKKCKIILNSYYLLMNHRKKEHPTDKVCRYLREGLTEHYKLVLL